MCKDSNQGRIVRFALHSRGIHFSALRNTDLLVEHKVDRVLGFFSSRPFWDPPTPSPAAE
jgi:hypothetical protein